MSIRRLVVPLITLAVVIGLAGPAAANIQARRSMYYEGTGQALIKPFWVADGTTDTLIEVVNRASGLSQQGETTPTTIRKGRWILVHFTIHEEKDSVDVRDFNICLSPGDVWTAALTLEGGVTHLKSSDLSSGAPSEPRSALGPTPVDETLQPGPGGTNPVRGYISVVMIDNGTSHDAGCDGDHLSLNTDTGNDDNALFDSERHQALNAPLLGRSIYVNVGNGLATGFNDEAIKGYCSIDPDFWCLGNASVGPIGGAPGSVVAFRALALGQHRRNARGTLLGRWLRDAANNFDTQIVLTFPTGKTHEFLLCQGDGASALKKRAAFGTTTCGGNTTTSVPFDFKITAATQMTLWIRNDEECVSVSSRKIATPNEVNVITFTSLPTALFNTTDNSKDGVCKRADLPATAGWFRLLFDTNEDEVTDAVTGQFSNGAALPPTSVRVPKVIPGVGFVTITAPTTAARISATFPFQSEEPFDFYDCYNDMSISCETHDDTQP